MRETRRVKTALRDGSAVDAEASPASISASSLARSRADHRAAELKFIDRSERPLRRPPRHRQVATWDRSGVEAVKAGRSVHFITLADLHRRPRARLAGRLAASENPLFPPVFRCSSLTRSATACRPRRRQLVFPTGQPRYERGAMILTSNRGFAEWGEIFGGPWSPPRCLIACSTMLWWARSKEPATGSPTRRPGSGAHPLQGADPSAIGHHPQKRRGRPRKVADAITSTSLPLNRLRNGEQSCQRP